MSWLSVFLATSLPTISSLSDKQFEFLLHLELSHDDLRQIGMEKIKQVGDQSHPSKPTEGVKQPAVSGKSSEYSLLHSAV